MPSQLIKKSVFCAAMLATALTSVTPAMANDTRYRRHGNGDAVGAAVAGGIIGLAIGALLASGSKDRDRICDDPRRADPRCYRNDGARYDDYGTPPYRGNDPYSDQGYADNGDGRDGYGGADGGAYGSYDPPYRTNPGYRQPDPYPRGYRGY